MLKWIFVTIDTVFEQTSPIEGCLTMNVCIDTTDVHEKFFVMK